MKKLLILIFCVIIFTGCSYDSDIGGELISVSENSTIEEIADAITPAVVGISGVKGSSNSVGSGVCVATNGYIVTNSHVVHDADEIVLHLSNKTTAKAKIIHDDTVLDFAIIKSEKSIPYLKLSMEDVRVGKDILAVGTPLSLNLTHTFTKGIVSATDRTIKVTKSYGEGYMQNLIQHDASLNPGNSGGPLINLNGEIVGINTLKISGGEGIGFAIPVKSFKSLLENYVEIEDYKTPYLGVYGIDGAIANYQGKTQEDSGFYVIDIAENSPLQNVKKCGVIKKINGVEISNALDFRYEFFKYKKGDNLNVEYIEDGQKKNINVVV